MMIMMMMMVVVVVGDASAAFQPMYLYAWPGYTLYIGMINDKFMMCYDSQRCQEPAYPATYTQASSTLSISQCLCMLFISMSM